MKNISETPAAAENVAATLLTLDEIVKRRHAAELQHKAEIAVIEAQQAEVTEIQRPLHVQLTAHRLLLERIQKAEKQRIIQAELAGEFDNIILDRLVGNADAIGDGDIINFGGIHQMGPAMKLVYAERGVILIDRWLTTKRAELAEIEKTLRAYATQHALDYLLPDDFKQVV